MYIAFLHKRSIMYVYCAVHTSNFNVLIFYQTLLSLSNIIHILLFIALWVSTCTLHGTRLDKKDLSVHILTFTQQSRGKPCIWHHSLKSSLLGLKYEVETLKIILSLSLWLLQSFSRQPYRPLLNTVWVRNSKNCTLTSFTSIGQKTTILFFYPVGSDFADSVARCSVMH